MDSSGENRAAADRLAGERGCRVVYVSGVGPGDGRGLIELGLTELLARRAQRVAVFRPLGRAGEDPVIELLRVRHRIELPRELLYGFSYEQAAVIRARQGTDELVRLLVDRLRELSTRCEAVLVLGSDYSSGTLPDEPAFNARLANEFGALLVPVVGGNAQHPDAMFAEVSNAYRAYADQGCAVVAVIANRVPPGDVAALTRALAADPQLPVPAYVIPEEPSIQAPTVAQAVRAARGKVLLGDETGLERQVRGFVFGAAMLPRFLTALTDGCLVISPGDRADLLIGALAARSTGSPAISGVLLTLGQPPEEPILRLADRLAPGLPVALTEADSFSTAATLSALKGELTTGGRQRVDAALGLFDLHVDTGALAARIALGGRERVTPMMFERALMERARGTGARDSALRDIVLAEGEQERILRAAEVLIRRAVCNLTLLGPEELIRKRAAELGLDLGLEPGLGEQHGARVRIIDPATSPLHDRFAQAYARLRAHKGVTEEQARDMVLDPNYFGTMLVHEGLADGLVSGVAHSTAATLRPAFEIIGTAPQVTLASSVFFMCLPDRVLVYGDCAVNPDPDAAQLADIAIRSAQTAARFGIEPRIALLSYSTGRSGAGADVEKVRKATEIVRTLRPELLADGPMQYDAAVEPQVAAAKAPGSAVAGQATVLVFPDLNTGNNTYKAVQRSAGAVAIGPIMQGLNKPINDLSRGALIEDIVTTVAITAIQAQPGGNG